MEFICGSNEEGKLTILICMVPGFDLMILKKSSFELVETIFSELFGPPGFANLDGNY